MTYLPEPNKNRDLYAGGPSVSSIAWGMWRFCGADVNAAQARVQAALDAGVTLFDTADIYGPDNGEPFGAAEALLGAVLKQAPALAKQMVIATKGGIEMGVPYNSSQTYLTSAIDASLSRMGVEHVALVGGSRVTEIREPNADQPILGFAVRIAGQQLTRRRKYPGCEQSGLRQLASARYDLELRVLKLERQRQPRRLTRPAARRGRRRG